MGNHGEEVAQIDISLEEKEKLVAEVVRYVLFKTHQTAGCPIKREELTQLVTRNYRQRSLPAVVIQEAGAKLSSVFGYKLKELQRARSSSIRPGRSLVQVVEATKSYVLESQIPPDIYKSFVEDKKNSHLYGFTFAVIGNIYLSGGKISEENLWHHLRRLELKENDENHPIFGNVKNLLETLVQQRYLQKEKLSGVEGNSVMYELAERALDESFIQRVEDYIAKIAKRGDAHIVLD